MDIFNLIAERKISAAIAQGAFDNLKLKGQKLNLERDPLVPSELQMGYHILKNAGMVPEEISLGNEICSLKDLMLCSLEPDENQQLAEKIRLKILQLNILQEKRGRSPALQDYLSKLEAL